VTLSATGARQIQEDFVRTSLERMNQFALCCVELLQAAGAGVEDKAEEPGPIGALPPH
jgi:hypothetical protein